MRSTATAALSLLSLFATLSAAARSYTLEDSFVGEGFLDGFIHEDFDDPTHGRVNYVDECTALEKNLTYFTDDTFVMRADYKTNLTADGPGRDSVRISSKKQYGYSVMILDLEHMPTGCGTWPAFWTFSTNNTWPAGGEIDILEGVNDKGPNSSVLHTEGNCTMVDSTMKDTGSIQGAGQCQSSPGNGAGCVVKSPSANSYGPALNEVGGGWFAMERTASFINVWFWSRNDTDVPAQVKNAGTSAKTIDPSTWGLPYANFASSVGQCNIQTEFQPQNIIINLTLCGDWAGNAYPQDGSCPRTCVDHVNYDAADFEDAFWSIRSLNVFEAAGKNKRHIHQPSGSQRSW